MLRVGMVGLGKMGLSHHAIVKAHPGVNVVAACDQAAYLTSVLTKYTGLKCYDDYERLLATEALDAVIIATPSKLHAAMVEKALERGLHVFCEKPFVLDIADGERLVALAESKGLVNSGWLSLSLCRRIPGGGARRRSRARWARFIMFAPKPTARWCCGHRGHLAIGQERGRWRALRLRVSRAWIW